MAANSFWRTLTRFDRSKIATEIAVRNTIGFVAAFTAATLISSPSAGVLAALGALNAGYSDSRDPYASRARRMLLCSLMTGVAVTTGALSGHSDAAAVLAAALWAFGGGMLLSLGANAGDLGVITLVTLVVFAARPLSINEALQSGLVATAGGLLQTLLAIAFWPVSRYEPERRILGELYRSLAGMARASTSHLAPPPLGAQISDAQDKLAALQSDHGDEAERLIFLLNQAERIRLSLLTLSRLGRRMLRDPTGAGHSAQVDAALAHASKMLDDISVSAQRGARTADPPTLEAAINDASADSPFFRALVADARQQLEALGGQLRAANGASLPSGAENAAFTPSGTFTGRLQERLAKIRANLSFHSTVFRHAIRLAVCLGVGDALGRGLSLQRSYWIPMTVAIVLKPDFTGTLSRGVLRIAGTYVGLLLATGLFHFVHTGWITDVALMGAFTFLFRWVGAANYGIFVTAVSAMIVLLIAATGVAPRDVIIARALNTSLGGLLAMIAYVAWPTWEKRNVAATLADLLESYRAYFNAVIAAYEGGSTAAIDSVRVSGRRARSNAEASIDRLQSEPRVSTARLNALSAVLVNSHSFVHAVMALEAGLYRTGTALARSETVQFAAQVDETLQAFAQTLRTGGPVPGHLPDLRAAHSAMTGSAAPASARYTLVNTETDRIVTSLNTLGEHILDAVKE